jgi:hypothetical protein
VAERDLVYEILLTWGAHPLLRIWRANTGVGWFKDGQPARKTDKGAYPVKFGTPGQADITGLVLPIGRRLEIECKAKTKQSDDQRSYQRMIENFGGLYVLAHSVDDVDRALAALGVRR